jgi:hypothetical protein
VFRPEKENKSSSANSDNMNNNDTNVVNDEDNKEKDFEKVMQVYEDRKKAGLSESLTNELKNRKRKQQQQRHRNQSSEIFLCNECIIGH